MLPSLYPPLCPHPLPVSPPPRAHPTPHIPASRTPSRLTVGCSPVRSLEQMLASSPGKTPISLLQEYGTRIGRTPGYDLLKAEGQAHQPNFTFRVTVGDVSCTGGS